MPKREKQNKNKSFLILLIITILGIVVFYIFKNYNSKFNFQDSYDYAVSNYKKDVDKYSTKYKLPSSYLMALIMLECSGRKEVPARFEKKIYHQLVDLKNGKIDHFEDLTQKDLKIYSEKDLKSLSHSYGPFQIMGYKAIKMRITIDELYGDNAVKYGIIWINKEYGNLLRQGRFADAFHFHNTGKVIPSNGQLSTYDPKYVKRGLEYMRYFSKND